MHSYINKTNHWKKGILQRWPNKEEKKNSFFLISPLREMYNETRWRYAILKFNTTSLYLKLYSPTYPITALLIPSKLKYNFSLIFDLKDVKLLIKRVTWQSSRQKSYFKMLLISEVCLDTSKEKSITEVPLVALRKKRKKTRHFKWKMFLPSDSFISICKRETGIQKVHQQQSLTLTHLAVISACYLRLCKSFLPFGRVPKMGTVKAGKTEIWPTFFKRFPWILWQV